MLGGWEETACSFVLVTMGAALTFLPAMIGLLGRRVDSLRLPWHHRTQELPADQLSRTLSARWAHEMARRPWLFAPASLVVLLVLTVPLLRIDLGFPTDASAPAGTTQRKAYDLITEGFGEGANGPLLLVGPLPRTPPLTLSRRSPWWRASSRSSGRSPTWPG